MIEVIEKLKEKEIEQGKEKRNVPQLRFKGFEEEWKTNNLDKVMKLSSGGTPSRDKSQYWNGNIPWVTTGEIKFNNIKDTTEKITTLALNNSSAKLFPEGTILIAMYGQGKTRGKSAILSIEAATNQACAALLPSNNMSSNFIYQYISNNYNKLREMCNLGSQKNLSLSIIGELKISFPSLQEQKKIAQFFTLIDKKIEKQSDKVEALKTYKKGIMQKIFKQEIRFKDDSGKEYPKWEEKKLGKILRERKLYSKKGFNYPHVTLSKDGIYDKGERYDRDFLVKNDSKEYKVTFKDDICYNPANLKFGVICRNKYGSAIFSPIYVTFEVIGCNNIFIEYLVVRNNFINKVRKYEEGTVYERMAVKPQDLLKFNVKIPCLKEQTQIANFLSRIDKKIEKEEEKLDELKSWKKGLLQKMFL